MSLAMAAWSSAWFWRKSSADSTGDSTGSDVSGIFRIRTATGDTDGDPVAVLLFLPAMGCRDCRRADVGRCSSCTTEFCRCTSPFKIPTFLFPRLELNTSRVSGKSCPGAISSISPLVVFLVGKDTTAWSSYSGEAESSDEGCCSV